LPGERAGTTLDLATALEEAHTVQTPIVEGIAPDLLNVVRENNYFRRVVATGEHEQVVVMTLGPGEDIGSEVHPGTDQFFLFVEGSGDAVMSEEVRTFDEGDIIFVRAGTRHNIINRGIGSLRLITVYAPPQHARGTIHRTKAEAQAAEERSSFDEDEEFLLELC
jgi:mannose-6-phosphate isomerase-like protein (cupin superfamily)